MNESIIENAVSFVTELFRGNAGGHGADHTLRVYRNARLIAAEEPECDLFIVSLAALLHDADDHKLFQTENNANARGFLTKNGVSLSDAERILAAVNAVSFSQNGDRPPETPEGKIVQDADRLDAIGAVGVARTFAYGGEHGRDLADSLQHFHDKLLRLKDLMNTPTGRRMAARRHDFLIAFLRQYAAETGDSADGP